MSGVLQTWPHYDQVHIKTMEEVRSLLQYGADDLNWLFLSTSGVHGSYRTLDDIEKGWDTSDGGRSITVLIVRPRLVSIRYGEIPLTSREDILWLRLQVEKTIQAVIASQKGNGPPYSPAS